MTHDPPINIRITTKAKFKDEPDISKGEQKINKYLVKQLLSEEYINQVLKFMVGMKLIKILSHCMTRFVTTLT